MRYGNTILLAIAAIFLAEMAIVSSNPAINKLTGDTALSEPHAFTSETGYPAVGSEERVGGIDVSAKVKNLMNKLLQSTSSTKSAAIKSLLNSKIHPNELLGAIRVNGDITKLDDNPELLQWFQFAAAYRKKNGDQALPDLEIYFMLVRQYQVNEVTSLIQALTKTPGLKKLGTSMENSLSGSWINKALKRKTDPTVLFNTLHLKEAGAKLDEVPVFHQWLKYVDSYRTMMGYARFTNSEMLELFQKSMPEEDLVALLHRLRQTPGMTEHADTMQRMLFELSKSSHQLMLNMWLKAQESPENVYKILRLGKVEMDGFGDNGMAIQWLRYTKLFRDQTPSHAFSDVQTVKFLHEERPLQSDWKLATFFQTLKETPDLKRQAENMQVYLFQSWVKDDFNPKEVAHMLGIPHSVSVVMLPKSDPRRLAWEAFTLYFAKYKGGEAMLKKVKEALVNGNPRVALAATMK